MTIKWNQFKKENLVAFGKPKSKEVTTETGAKATNWTIDVRYRTDDGKLEYFEVCYPTLNSFSGIVTKPMTGYTKYQITGNLESENEAQQKLNDEFYQEFAVPLNERVIELIAEKWKEMGKSTGVKIPKNMTELEYYGMQVSGNDKYQAPFFLPFDKESKETIEGGVAKTVIPLKNFENRHTKFTDMAKKDLVNPQTGKPCSFEECVDLLSNIGFKFRPCVSFNKISVGAVFRIDSMMSSAIVWDFKECSEESHQDDDAQELQQEYGTSAVDTYNQKLLELKKNKMGQRTQAAIKSSDDTETSTGTVFSGGKASLKSKPAAVPTATVKKPSTVSAPASKKPVPKPELEADESDQNSDTEAQSENDQQNDASSDTEATQPDHGVGDDGQPNDDEVPQREPSPQPVKKPAFSIASKRPRRN